MDSYDVLLELVLQKWRVVVWADQGELQKKIQKKHLKVCSRECVRLSVNKSVTLFELELPHYIVCFFHVNQVLVPQPTCFWTLTFKSGGNPVYFLWEIWWTLLLHWSLYQSKDYWVAQLRGDSLPKYGCFLASQDALEVMGVTEWLSDWLSPS